MPSPNLLKSQSLISNGGGGQGGLEFNFQLLMQSPNLLKSQSSILRSPGGGGGWNPTFKSQLQTFKPKSLVEISISGGGGGWNPWNLVLSPLILSECITDSFPLETYLWVTEVNRGRGRGGTESRKSVFNHSGVNENRFSVFSRTGEGG